MANTFKNALTASIGTSPTTVYTAPAATASTVIGATVANRTSTAITVDVTVVDSSASVTAYLGRYIPVPAGSSVIVVGGQEKVVLETGDYLQVVSSADTSADAIVSVLEIS